jgi:predicted secreted protein
MSTREFAAQALSLILPFFITLLGILMGLATNWVRTHYRIGAQNTAVDAVREAAMTAASSAMQRMVTDLKDPTKPGTWGAIAAASVKSSVVQDAQTLSAQALARLKSSNWTDEQRTKLVEQLVERAVLEIKSRAKPAAVVNNGASQR